MNIIKFRKIFVFIHSLDIGLNIDLRGTVPGLSKICIPFAAYRNVGIHCPARFLTDYRADLSPDFDLLSRNKIIDKIINIK